MQLAPGDRLGPYQITAAIGAGGMGQLYKAKDTRLDRTVAIKILPATLAVNDQFRERFAREARAISQLDHPHICPLHDVGEHNGTAYLVMPFLEGETLERRLERGALPPLDVFHIGAQIADGLARAHSGGIIHRDLKPANIMLTKAGARLLDFGLARNHGRSPLHSPSETRTERLTSQGTIIGTFQYMAPEQIEGAEGDVRTDVWGFGCVLYEMFTGTRPFEGKSTPAVLANIINGAPQPIRDRQPRAGRAADHIVRRCLEKDPDARWQSMADVAHELRWAAATDDPAPIRPRPIWLQPAAYAIALLFLVAGLGLAQLRQASPPPPTQRPLKLAFVAPSDLTLAAFGSNGNPHFALSPDGSRIAYVAAAVGHAPSLWVQRLDSRSPREIPGSSNATAPFWSPDSKAVAFFSEGKLRRSAIDGEESQVLATTDATGGTWSGDVILVGNGFGPIVRLAAGGGGRPTPATTIRPPETGHRWPHFLADGQHFVYGRAGAGGVAIAALDSDASGVLFDPGSTAVPAGPSTLLFVRPGTRKLQAQEIDVQSMRVTGVARDLLEGVQYVGGSGYPPASVAENGLLAYWDGTTLATELGWHDRSGTLISGLAAPADALSFSISPDGRRLAYIATLQAGNGVWLMDMAGVTTRLAVEATGASRPIWARDDGSSISLSAKGKSGIALIRRAIGGDDRQIALGEVRLPEGEPTNAGNFYANDWSRDGRQALVSVTQADTGRDIVLFSLPTGTTTPLVVSNGQQVQPRFSPDDRRVAYTSNETGRWEVFVETLPRSSSRVQVSNNGGSQPIWRRDGRELFYAAPDGKLMVVAVAPGDRWIPANPRVLFQTRMRPLFAPYPYTYDVSPDGQRFLISDVRPGTGSVISIVTDWRAK